MQQIVAIRVPARGSNGERRLIALGKAASDGETMAQVSFYMGCVAFNETDTDPRGGSVALRV